VFNVSPDDKDPKVNRERADLKLEEYGYGFWYRFLTVYPKRLIPGKNAPWYFIARLTANKNYQDITMGDRLLAIW
jgi:hypothetical protein